MAAEAAGDAGQTERAFLEARARKCIHMYDGCTGVATVHCPQCSDNFCRTCDVQHHEENDDMLDHEHVPLTYGSGIPYTSVVDCNVCQARGRRGEPHSCDPLSRYAPGLAHLRKNDNASEQFEVSDFFFSDIFYKILFNSSNLILDLIYGVIKI